MRYLSYLNSIVTDYFTFWIILFSLIAFFYPARFAGLTWLIVPVLGIIMFGMGMTLTGEDFRRIAGVPRDVAVGLAAQYGIMPVAGFLLAKIFSRARPPCSLRAWCSWNRVPAARPPM